MLKTFLNRTLVALSLIVLASSLAWGQSKECAVIFRDLEQLDFQVTELKRTEPYLLLADGTSIPFTRALEKEGLLYEDIAEWFPLAKPEVKDKLTTRLADEIAGKKPLKLTPWLKSFVSKKYALKSLGLTKKAWDQKTPADQLSFILDSENAFDKISIDGRTDLFYEGVLTFDDVAVVPGVTPPNIVVGDDLGSYEIRSENGVIDQAKYLTQRKIVETFMEGKVGHQHFIHAWPTEAQAREKMAPQYIELLDSLTWYLFWRQAKRNPDDVESVLDHPYLGVYDRNALERLRKVVISGDASKFQNKFRMIGARGVKARPDQIPEQGEGYLPDWEMRSGSKGLKRDLVERVIQARISSGDYSGLRDFRNYQFAMDKSLREMTSTILDEKDLAVLDQFEKDYPALELNMSKKAYNHYRNKILSPLFDWTSRLNVDFKKDLIAKAQSKFAQRLVEIGRSYLKKFPKAQNTTEKGNVRQETMEELMQAVFEFSDKVRLDMDFENYLTPVAKQLPSILVTNNGPMDVNKINLGLEYSFRFPSEIPITSKKIAEREILRHLTEFQKLIGGGQIQRTDNAGHGHNASVKYTLTDKEGNVWRVEWDGIQRSYVDGVLMRPRRGHAEVPTPKKAPQSMEEFRPIFEAARASGQIPKRVAGGGHVNVDLAPLTALDPRDGARKLMNLIAFYESNREMVTFLWQHPLRLHAAPPMRISENLAKEMETFNGDWYDLAALLYNERYFNTYITRKPRYMELNVTAAMAPAIPEEYRKGTLDIKNPTVKWFPDFGTTEGRIEFRLFDAPTEEYMAALQIKYVRALLNKAWNSDKPIGLHKIYAENSREYWTAHPEEFVKAARAHFELLGLNPEEFMSLIPEAVELNKEFSPREKPLEEYPEFLPVKPRLPKVSGWPRYLEAA